jgi:hypothetical protein
MGLDDPLAGMDPEKIQRGSLLLLRDLFPGMVPEGLTKPLMAIQNQDQIGEDPAAELETDASSVEQSSGAFEAPPG